MIKQAPSRGRMLVIAAFSLSCLGLLLYLWQAFGGAMPLQPKSYRFQVSVPGAITIADQADVRISGIDVGKVVDTARDGNRLKVTVQLEPRYAPLPSDSRAMVRTKTVLGESFIALTPGSDRAPKLPDGGTLRGGQVGRAVTIDEFLGIFDRPTRRALQRFTAQLGRALRPGSDVAVNDALGVLPGFVDSGDTLMTDLNARGRALQHLIADTGTAFDALAQRRGQLRALQVNGRRFLSATAREHTALEQTIFVMPTFLSESTATVDRLERFARDTTPLVRALLPVAGQLAPAIRELGTAAPPLQRFFTLQRPLLAAAQRGLPDAARLLDGTIPLLDALRPFLDQLNPGVGFLNFNRDFLAGILAGGNGFAAKTDALGDGSHHYLRSYGIVNDRTLSLTPGDHQSSVLRTNAYVAPNAYRRLQPVGALESWDCTAAGGEQPDPRDGLPPCADAPPSLWDGKMFPLPKPGLTPLKAPPQGLAGTRPPRRSASANGGSSVRVESRARRR